jgi:hypothetical protein
LISPRFVGFACGREATVGGSTDPRELFPIAAPSET